MSASLAPIRQPFAALFCLVVLVCTGWGVFSAPAAQAQDQVGIYWDAGFTEVVASTVSIPGVITGYVVLHDPTGSGGVLGWEACIEVDGPGVFAGWDFQGQGINAGTAPCIAVGYTSPLPQSADIVLATFELVATAEGPIELTMKPDWFASLPGQMSYIPGDNPADLIAMTTATGKEIVAGLNGGNPWVSLDREVIDFGATALGQSSSEFLVITNESDVAVPLDLSITDLCDFFTLPGGTGPGLVPAQGSLSIEVVFSPVQERQVICYLSLGPNLPPVTLTGSGLEPVTDWRLIGTGGFGYVYIGDTPTRMVTLQNTGQTVIHLDAAFLANCPDFVLASGGGPVDVSPGASHDFVVRFSPTIEGYQGCSLTVGHPDIPNILFEGFGRPPTTTWTAPTRFNFLVHYVGVATSTVLTITNTGGTVIPLHASLPPDCEGFTALQGAGYDVSLQPGQSHVVSVQFLAAVPGHYQCHLDLGAVVPPIQLDGEAIAGPSSVTVTPSQLNFPATLVSQAAQMSLVVTNIVGYDVPLDVQLSAPNSAFSVLSGGGPQVLASGASATVTVRFAPQATVFYEAVLLLGDPQPSVVLKGVGYEGTADCRIEPASLDFGDVVLGQFADRQVTITNDGTIAMLLEPATTAAEFHLDVPPLLLNPGQSHTYTVRYQPTALGADSGSLLLGATACNAVGLAGGAVINPSQFTVDPDTVDIAAVPVNTIVDNDVVITNLSGYVLQLDVQVLAPTIGFSLLAGGGSGQLFPGDSRTIRVRFVCVTERTYATSLFLGEGLPLVPLFAEGVVIRPDCELDSPVVNFGTAPVGGLRTRYVGITNNGETDLVLNPASDTPAFEVSGDPIVIAPEGTATLAVRFRPTQSTTYSGTIDLGNALCADVLCFGEGVPVQSFDQDLIGIFFNTAYTDNFAYAYQAGQLLTGYLVLSNPSTTGGVSGWECRVELDDSALITDWALEGQPINIGQNPDFVVGLASPLPYTSQALLATFECLVLDPGTETVLRLKPVLVPSVPDQMSWVPGSDPGNLLSMNTLWGLPDVAVINGNPLAVAAPTPVARLLGQQVDLSWPVPTEPHEGCHVYRRLADQAAVRLTSLPLVGTGAQLTYTDVTSGLVPGSTVYYSYAIVRDGAELARSAEVEITLPSLPAAASRLLPNVPNPFNPMTEIRFELSESQTVSLKIYDVTGRFVRELASGSLAAGPHSRVWQGRDSNGRQVPSGGYYVRLVTGNVVDQRKIMLLK